MSASQITSNLSSSVSSDVEKNNVLSHSKKVTGVVIGLAALGLIAVAMSVNPLASMCPSSASPSHVAPTAENAQNFTFSVSDSEASVNFGHQYEDDFSFSVSDSGASVNFGHQYEDDQIEEVTFVQPRVVHEIEEVIVHEPTVNIVHHQLPVQTVFENTVKKTVKTKPKGKKAKKDKKKKNVRFAEEVTFVQPTVHEIEEVTVEEPIGKVTIDVPPFDASHLAGNVLNDVAENGARIASMIIGLVFLLFFLAVAGFIAWNFWFTASEVMNTNPFPPVQRTVTNRTVVHHRAFTRPPPSTTAQFHVRF